MPFQNKLRCLDGNLDIVPCGLLVKTDHEVIGVPLEAVTAHIDIINVAAQITLTQTFVNNSPDTIQTVYFFPCEEKCTLYSFKATLDGSTVVGVVKDKETARQEFVDAVEKEKSAFLLEEVKPDILELFIGNLRAGSTCCIEVKYVQELGVQDHLPRFTLPTTIAPRYIPHSEDPAVASTMQSVNYQFNYMPDAPLLITVSTKMRTAICDVTSPTHQIQNVIQSDIGENGFYSCETSLESKTTSMDKDFVLIVNTKDPLKAIIVVEEKRLDDNNISNAVMISFVPQFDVDEQLCELIFLVDCSGSMSGKPIKRAVDALQIFLQSLPEDCFFNIFRFGSRYESLYEKAQKYTDETLTEAKEYGNNTFANLGGTEVLTPLEHILKQPSKENYLRQVLFLTDGEVSNTEAVIRCVADNRGAGRVFALGIGDCVSRGLVNGVARAGDGIASFCTMLEPMHEKVANLLNAALRTNTSITDIRFRLADKDLPTKYPIFKPIPVFNKEQVILYGIVSKVPDEVALMCQVEGKSLSLHFGTDNIVKIETTLIHKLTVRNMIKQSEELTFDPSLGDTKLKELALQEEIVSNFTSMVCVVDDDKKPTAIVQNVTKQNEYLKYDDILQPCSLMFSACNYNADLNLGCNLLRKSNPVGLGSKKKSASLSFPKLPSLKSLFRPSSRRKSAKCYTDECAAPRMISLSSDHQREDSDNSISDTMGSCPSESDSLQKDTDGDADKHLFTEQNLVQLLQLASIRGTFFDVTKVDNLLNIDVPGFLTDNNVNDVDIEVWLTCFVVVFLEKKCQHMKQSWKLVVKKSRKWLLEISNLKNIEYRCDLHIEKF